MESTTTTLELDQVKEVTPFDKLMQTINDGGMDASKKLDVLIALGIYIASK